MLHVAPQVGWVTRRAKRFGTFKSQTIEKGRGREITRELAHRHASEREPDDAAGPRPQRFVKLGGDRTRQEVAARSRVSVDGALDRSEDRRHDLPLIEEHRFLQPPQRGIRVGPEGHGLSLAVESNRRTRMAGCRGGLADRPGTDDEQRGQLCQQPTDQIVNQAWPVLPLHSVRLQFTDGLPRYRMTLSRTTERVDPTDDERT
jgi:hypothetical protein